MISKLINRLKKVSLFFWTNLISVSFHILLLAILLLTLSKFNKTPAQKDFIPLEMFKMPDTKLNKVFKDAEDIEEKTPTEKITDKDSDFKQSKNEEVQSQNTKNANEQTPTTPKTDDVTSSKEPTKKPPIEDIITNPKPTPESYNFQKLDSATKYTLPENEVRDLNYSMSDYSWSFETYVEQWALKIIKAWQIPIDYAKGLFPSGGYVVIKVEINKNGELLGFEVVENYVSREMSLKSLQALIGSFTLNKLPEDSPDKLDFYWKFIYPSYKVFDGTRK